MLKNQKKMVFFGLQAFIQEYLIEYFNTWFFKLPESLVASTYISTMNIQLTSKDYDLDPIIKLHRLGYLPLHIRALPEGTLVPMTVPCIEISNTHQDFASMFAQDKYGYDGKQYTDLGAFIECLRRFKANWPAWVEECDEIRNTTVALPYKIGCGRGGADWENDIYPIIKRELEDYDVELWRYKEW